MNFYRSSLSTIALWITSSSYLVFYEQKLFPKTSRDTILKAFFDQQIEVLKRRTMIRCLIDRKTSLGLLENKRYSAVIPKTKEYFTGLLLSGDLLRIFYVKSSMSGYLRWYLSNISFLTSLLWKGDFFQVFYGQKTEVFYDIRKNCSFPRDKTSFTVQQSIKGLSMNIRI